MAHSFRRLGALIRKEMVQLVRDWRLLMLLFFLPAFELFLFVYAVTLTTNHLPTALVDQSMDARSRDFITALESSSYFDMNLVLQNEQQVIQAVNAGQVKVGVVIPPNFAEDVERGLGHVLILLDGSDSFSVQSAYSAASAIAQRYSLDLTTRRVSKAGTTTALSAGLPLTLATRVLYNPDMKDLVFILPGLIALIIQNIIVAYSAGAIVREREAGTYEQLLSTPARPAEMVISKMAPGAVVVAVDLAAILLLGVFVFGVPFEGSVLLFIMLSALFIVASMGLGLLISSVARTQRQAQQLTNVLNLFAMLLTGFIYPRNTMPLWTRIIGDMIPLTYYMNIVRGIITKGVGLAYLWQDSLILLAYTLLTFFFAALAARKRLD